MNRLKVVTLVLGPIGTNTYIVHNAETGACVIVDPADEAGRIEEKVRDLKLKPEAVLLTHGHCDHFMAADEVRKAFGIPVYAMAAEKATLEDTELNASVNILGIPATLKADHFFMDGDRKELIGTEWTVIATPGHTRGACCYYVADEHILFSGDTLFCESYGRCDMPGGNESLIIRSIQKLFKMIPDDTKIYTGHMESTDMRHEKQYNPIAFYGRNE